MALTYEWSINSLKKKDQVNSEGATLEGAVVQTYWKVIGTDENGHAGEFQGATPFSAENVPAGSFVAFEDLTEETVCGWVQNIVNNDPVYKAHIDERIRHNIDVEHGLEVEVNESDLPWSTGDVTPVPSADADADAEADPAE